MNLKKLAVGASLVISAIRVTKKGRALQKKYYALLEALKAAGWSAQPVSGFGSPITLVGSDYQIDLFQEQFYVLNTKTDQEVFKSAKPEEIIKFLEKKQP